MEKLHPKSQAALAAFEETDPPMPEPVLGDPTKPASPEEREYWQKQNAFMKDVFTNIVGDIRDEFQAIVKDTELFTYTSEDGTYEIESRFFRAKTENADDKPPLVIHFHGGGMTLLSRDEIYELRACSLVQKLGCSVLTPEFRNARDVPFPAPVDDCLETVKWAHANRDMLGFGDTVITCGASGGGNLAIATYIRAIEKGLDAKALISGIFADCPFIRPSYVDVEKMKDLFSPLTPAESLQPCCNNYTKSEEDSQNPSAWPLLSSKEILAKFPPTCLRGEEFDVLREDARDLYQLLSDAGVEGCSYAEKKNCFHGGSLMGMTGDIDWFLVVADIAQFAKALSSMKKMLQAK